MWDILSTTVMSAASEVRAFNMRAHIIGVSERLTNPDMRTAVMMVTENSMNTLPVMPLMKTSGMKTAASERVMLKIVKDISRAERNVAVAGDSPKSSMRLTVFSRNTMASSTRNPIAIVSPMSDKLFTENPNAYMNMNVSRIENGSATVGIIVSRILPKNRNITNTTRRKAIMRVSLTSSILSIMRVERSYISDTFTLEGRIVLNSSTSFFISATVVMALPSERFLMPMAIDAIGLPSGFLLPSENDMLSVSYWMVSTALAMSRKKIGEPSLKPTTMLS